MQGKITFTIDGLTIAANEGDTILKAALEHGIYIPHLCYHPDLKPFGGCRLCIVEIKGKGLTISCKAPVEEGIAIITESPEINNVRRIAAELLIVNHEGDCLECTKNTECKLQDIAVYLGIEEGHLSRLKRVLRNLPIDDSNPFFFRDPNKCVLCGICIRTCDEILGVGAIDFAFRGYATKVSTIKDKPIVESNCVSCGECVVRCPVGALAPKTTQRPAREVKSICAYCGVGCGIHLGVRGSSVVNVRGDTENPVNKGRLCVKGRFGYEFINHPDRLTSPLIKKDGIFVEATWDEVLELVIAKLGGYKGDQFAAISSARCTNEDNYVFQKFTRGVMGTNNIDHCARLCHAPTVTGLVQSFGSGAMTNSIEEIADAECILAIGTNTTVAHPIIGLQIKKAVRNGSTLIVANPQEIELCRFASIYLQHHPGTDVALLMGMMRVIVDEELFDASFIEDRCENFEVFKNSLENFDLESVQQITGVPKEKIIAAARIYAARKPGSILYCMGITQHSHGTDNVLAISNLAMLAGNIGKPSTGVNPLRGQNNVQGACDMGCLPDVYPGYKPVANLEARRIFEAAWDCSLSASPGLTHTEIFDAICEGKIKALYLSGENPILSEANAKHAEDAIDMLEFFIVQDIFLSETARLADVILPAASFAEKDGTFTNTERRIQRIRKAIEPIGDSWPDWQITCEIAKRMGGKGFNYGHPAEIMEEIASLTPTYKGVSYARLENGGLQWPCPTSEHPGTPILHTNCFATQNGKGKFVPLEYKPPAEVIDEEYPLVLTTARSLFHYHTSTMTRRVEGLNVLHSQELVQINPKDAANLGISDGEMVRVISRRGKVPVKAKVTDICPPGVVSMTFHFAESRTNLLTSPALDPIAKIPETKVCAVRVEKVN